MALVLTLRQGDDFYVRDDRVVLEEICSDVECSLRRSSDNMLIRLRAGLSVELFPDVFVSVAARGQLGLSRISFAAPRSVPILRGDLYRNPSARNRS